MTRKERLELIDRYKNGRLEGLALQRFERQLETDEALRKDFRLDKELSEAMNESSDYNLFKELVGEAEDNYFGENPRDQWNMSRVAAIISFFLISSITIWWFATRDLTPDQRFEKAFTAYKAPANFRGSELANMDDDFMLGLIKYEKAEYRESIRLFEMASSKDQTNFTARFLLAMSHMSLRQFAEAKPILEILSADDDHLFQDPVRWYLGLLYLADGDESNDSLSRALFDRIENKEYKEMVRSLR
ncbi:MAG: hypothetical protein HEP71_26530 [Roseivirga sp.]|nr:hypothetical protein [Roseivirga sp.]